MSAALFKCGLVNNKYGIKCCEKNGLNKYYYYNLNLTSKDGLIKKTEIYYPYYPNVENGDTFYCDIIEFLKSTIKYLKHETKEKNGPLKIVIQLILKIKKIRNDILGKKLINIFTIIINYILIEIKIILKQIIKFYHY